MRKRAISAVLAASMMLSVVPAPAFAAGNYTGGGMLPDEVTAQTLEQENAVDSTTTEITSNPAEGTTFTQDVTIKGGRVDSCTFEGKVTIDGNIIYNCTFKKGVTIIDGNVQSCKFNGTVEIQKSSINFGNTFYNNVKILTSGCSIPGATFMGNVTGATGDFDSCTFKGTVPSGSAFVDCVFAQKPTGIANLITVKVDSTVDASKLLIKSSDAPNAVNITGKEFYAQPGNQYGMYVYDSDKLITHIDDNPVTDTRTTISGKYSIVRNYNGNILISNINSSVNEITLIHQDKPSPNLELGTNGYPKDADGKETDGNTALDYANWTFVPSDKGGVLTLLSGDFSLSGSVPYEKISVGNGATLKDSELSGKFNLSVSDGGTIASGTYKCGNINNHGTINGGSFESTSNVLSDGTINGGTYHAAMLFTNSGTINGGTFFADQSFVNNNEITGGIFLSYIAGTAAVQLPTDAANYTVNGLKLPSGSDVIYIMTNGTTEQSLTLKYTGDEDVYSWHASALGIDLGRFYAGYAPITGEELAENAGLTGDYADFLKGITSISTNKEDKSLTLTATSISPLLSAKLEAIHKPTYRADDVTVKLGGQTISGDNSLKYSPEFANGFIVTSSDKTFTEDTDYEVKITDFEGKPVDSFDIKPGTYKLAITFKDTADHTDSTFEYNFTIEKTLMPRDLFEQYFTVELPGNGNVPYNGSAYEAKVTRNDNAPASIGEVGSLWYGSLATRTAPTDPGTYPVMVDIQESDYYRKTSFTFGKFTISKAELPEGTFQYDLETGTLTSDDEAIQAAIDAGEFTASVVYERDGKTYTEDKLKDAPAGDYTVSVAVTDSKGRYEDVTFETAEKKTVEKRDLSEDNISIDTTSPEYNGKPQGVTVTVSGNQFEVSDSDITITYKDADGNVLTSAPTNAGKYTYTVTIENSNYNQLTLPEGTFTIEQRLLVPEDFSYTAPEGLNTDSTEEEIIAAIKKGLTCNIDGLSDDDITVNLDNDPTAKGEHYFDITVNDNDNFTAYDGISSMSWAYTIGDALYPINSIPNATVTDENGHELTGPVPAGTKVFVHLDRDSLPEDFEFLGWQFTEGSAPVDANDCNLALEDAWFIMPKGGASLELIAPTPDSDSTGTVVAAVIGTATVGGAAYLVGTQVWLQTNLPKGAAIPTNRQQLADLLWTAAGKPEPKSNVLFTDIAATAADSQKAARWCVEQGLLKDTGEAFKPGEYTFRPQVIKAWNDLQAQLKADK